MRMTKFSQDIAKYIALLFIILLKFLYKKTFIFYFHFNPQTCFQPHIVGGLRVLFRRLVL